MIRLALLLLAIGLLVLAGLIEHKKKEVADRAARVKRFINNQEMK